MIESDGPAEHPPRPSRRPSRPGAEPAAEARAGAARRRLRGALGAALLALTAIAYLPVAESGFVWDDDDYVTENRTLRSAEGLSRIWLELGAIPQYYPLVHTTYWLEYRLWGLDPLGYHVVNVLLHALAVLLLWRVLAALAVPGAWWAAAIFALHPLHVESVAWITERKNVLSGALCLASFLAWLHWARRDRDPAAPAAERLYALSLVCFFGALLSKTVVASLPAVLLVVYWWKRWPIDRALLAALAPFFVLGIAFGLFTSLYERVFVGASGDAWELSVLERVLVAGRALWFYLGKLLWPHPLVFNYPRWSLDAGAAWQYAYPAAALALAIALFALRERLGRGALAAGLVYAGSLFPALGFFDVYPMRYAFVADHFCYLASAAPIAWGVAVVTRLSGRAVRGAAVAGAAVLVLLGALTWQQIAHYRDAETLWRATLRDNPGSWLAHSHLCDIERRRGALEAAGRHCRELLRLAPDDPKSHHASGVLELARGDLDAAMRHYHRALALDPDFFYSLNGLGVVLNMRGDPERALSYLDRALAAWPGSADAHTNRGNALAALGRLAEAERAHRRALGLAPDSVDAHNNLAAVLLARGRAGEAREHLARVVELDPGSAEARRRLQELEARIGGRSR